MAPDPEFIDPRIKTEIYIKSHNVDGMFESIISQLIVNKPEAARPFIVDALVKIKESGPQTVMTDADLETMFGMLDITGKKHVSVKQADAALRTILGARAVPSEDQSATLDLAGFVAYMAAGIKEGISKSGR